MGEYVAAARARPAPPRVSRAHILPRPRSSLTRLPRSVQLCIRRAAACRAAEYRCQQEEELGAARCGQEHAQAQVGAPTSCKIGIACSQSVSRAPPRAQCLVQLLLPAFPYGRTPLWRSVIATVVWAKIPEHRLESNIRFERQMSTRCAGARGGRWLRPDSHPRAGRSVRYSTVMWRAACRATGAS